MDGITQQAVHEFEQTLGSDDENREAYYAAVLWGCKGIQTNWQADMKVISSRCETKQRTQIQNAQLRFKALRGLKVNAQCFYILF